MEVLKITLSTVKLDATDEEVIEAAKAAEGAPVCTEDCRAVMIWN